MASRLWGAASKAVFGGSHADAAKESSASTDSRGGTTTLNTTTTSVSSSAQQPLSSAVKSDSSSSYFGLDSSYFDSSSYWNYANQSINYASETTYLTLASVLSPFYADDSSSPFGASGNNASSSASTPMTSSHTGAANSESSSTSPRHASFLLRMADRSPARRQRPFQSGGGTVGDFTTVPPRLSWNVLTQNPYHSVRGRHGVSDGRRSLSAVRSFLALVPLDEEEDNDDNNDGQPDLVEHSDEEEEDTTMAAYLDPATDEMLSPVHQDEPHPHHRAPSFLSHHSSGGNNHLRRQRPPSRDETASQVAEGTLRALRDLALEEALELNAALRFWSDRWERPILSWLEAGPMVWTSPVGYRHRLIGERVAQLQAVLARRCAAIGELQEHLLRAGWQQGVAQWGVLDHFQAVSGVDGSIREDGLLASCSTLPSREKSNRSIPKPIGGPPLTQAVHHPSQQSMSESQRSGARAVLRKSSSHVGAGNREESSAHVLVRRGDGEGLYTDQPGFVAEWTVQAIALVRRHLYRAANGAIELPYEDNWPSNEVENGPVLPAWVSKVKRRVPGTSMDEDEEDRLGEDCSVPVRVSDLNLMMSEVSSLVNAMEGVMMLQRKRRLHRMRAPGWSRRNWYIIVTVGPAAGWFVYKGFTKSIVSRAVAHIRNFIKERLTEPLMAIVNEVWKGRGNFSDQKAKIETTKALKQMIKNWLDETYPKMEEAQRIALSEAMDMSLIEQKKAESMKTFFEINNVVRMSFIEMQYVKREMMSALAAMDEVMSANDINMNLAAITPVLIFVYVNLRMVRFLYHAVLRLGRSKEETRADFRTILTDIERLLVMRDSPPDLYRSGSDSAGSESVLNSDDLGMLMLLIHELRTILIRERRRFSGDEIRGLSEDLAEVAGERGAVSVRQQLQILTRMSRTYHLPPTPHHESYFQISRRRDPPVFTSSTRVGGSGRWVALGIASMVLMNGIPQVLGNRSGLLPYQQHAVRRDLGYGGYRGYPPSCLTKRLDSVMRFRGGGVGTTPASKLQKSLPNTKKPSVQKGSANNKEDPGVLALIRVLFLLYYGSLGALMPYLPVYYHSLGHGGQIIGVLGAVKPFTTFLVAPLWGLISDMLQKPFFILNMTFLVSAAGQVLVAFPSDAMYIIAMVFVTALFNAPVKSLLDSMVMEQLHDQSRYGRLRLWGQMGFGLGSSMTGWLLSKYKDRPWPSDTSFSAEFEENLSQYPLLFQRAAVYADKCWQSLSGFKLLFLTYAALSVPTFLGIQAFKRMGHSSEETPHHTKRKAAVVSKKKNKSTIAGLGLLLHNADALLFFFLVFVVGVSSGTIENFAYVRIREVGGSGKEMGLSRLVSSLAGAPMFWFSGPLARTLGVDRILVLTLISYVTRFIIYALMQKAYQGLPAEALRGVTFAAFWSSATIYAHKVSPAGLHATMLMMMNAMYGGLGQSLGAIVGGRLQHRFGTVQTFWYAAAFDAVFVAALIVYLSLRKESNFHNPHPIEAPPRKNN